MKVSQNSEKITNYRVSLIVLYILLIKMDMIIKLIYKPLVYHYLYQRHKKNSVFVRFILRMLFLHNVTNYIAITITTTTVIFIPNLLILLKVSTTRKSVSCGKFYNIYRCHFLSKYITLLCYINTLHLSENLIIHFI